MNTHEIIVYRSPLEKVASDFILAHPGYLVAAYIAFGIFFLFVLAMVVTIFIKVFRTSSEIERMRRRW